MTRRLALALALATALAPAAAGGERLDRPVPIEDPGGHALDRLHTALRGTAAGGRARLLFYGDSHTSLDQYTGVLRRALQARFGDAGPGFVALVPPFPCHGHALARVEGGGPWKILRVRGRHRAPDAYGPWGVAAETRGPAWGAVTPLGRGAKLDRARLLFLRRPGGGSLEVRVDGRRVRRLGTASKRLGLGSADIPAPGARLGRLEARALGDGPVRLFGVSLERDGGGVLVDALGVPSAKARDMLPWDEAVQREGLRLLGPDLVALAYGTNEAGGDRQSMPRYERDLRRVVGRIRATAPGSSCLLVGPTDWSLRRGDGSWAPRRRTAEITEVQRRVAAAEGCAFFDTLAFLGGSGSMPRWVAAGLAEEDHAHLTDAGHALLAAALERALLAGLDGGSRAPRRRPPG